MKRSHITKGWEWLSRWIVLISVVCPVSAAGIDCDQYLKEPESYNLGQTQIMHLQKVLDAERIAHGGDDGKLGPLTMAALKLYCLDVTEVVSYQLDAQDLDEFKLQNEIAANIQAIAPNADPAAITQSINTVLKDLPGKINPAQDTKDTIPSMVTVTHGATDQAQDQSDGKDTAYEVNPKLLERLRRNSISEDMMTLLQPLQGKQYASIALFDNAVEEHFKAGGQTSERYHGRARGLVQQAAQKRHPLDELDTTQWKSAKCGCVQDLYDRVVYGFYPYWLIADTAPTIDFSALSRIGYFALLMEPTGRLQEHALWKKEEHRAGFVKLAHRYRTKVDLVICHPDWPSWYRTVTDHQQTMIETVTGLVNTAPMCDGVTFYFKRYPENDAHSRVLAAFLKKLHEAMKDTRPDVYVNLMLPAVTRENPPTAKKEYENVVRRFFTNLFSNLQTRAADELDFVSMILVFVEEPTTYSKKQMRYIIEKSFKGEQRKAVLRKIVPILNPPDQLQDKRKKQQFEDDLIYFEDNFYGVGFWPLPTGREKTEITNQINDTFLKTKDRNIFQQFIYGRAQWLCKFICPNRVPVRWIMAAGMSFLLCWVVGSVWICELRIWYKKLFWYIIGLILVTSVLLIVLMTCDPSMMSRSTEIFIVLLIVLIGSAIYRQMRKMKQAEYP